MVAAEDAPLLGRRRRFPVVVAACVAAAGVVGLVSLARGGRSGGAFALEVLEAAAPSRPMTVFYEEGIEAMFVDPVLALLEYDLEEDFAFVPYDSLWGLLDEGAPEAGDVVLVALLTGMQTSRSPGCAFLFSEDPLLLNENVQSLLAYEKPLNIIETSDWGCRTNFPDTIHAIWKTSYSASLDRGSMANVRPLPFGIEYANASLFYGSAERLALPPSDRPVAVYWQGKYNYRKPSRKVMDTALGAVMDDLEAVAAAHRKRVIYEFVDISGKNEAYSDFYDKDGEAMSYMDMIGSALFVLCPFGDMAPGGMLWEALTYGAIPVVERRKEYKGCEDPLGWVARSGAPVIEIDDWATLPAVLEAELDDAEGLRRRVADLQAWWAETRKAISADLASLRATYADGRTPIPANTCAATALTEAEADALAAGYDAYFADDAWYDDHADSPSYPMTWCSTVQGTCDEADCCFDAACAPPAVAAFTCPA